MKIFTAFKGYLHILFSTWEQLSDLPKSTDDYIVFDNHRSIPIGTFDYIRWGWSI